MIGTLNAKKELCQIEYTSGVSKQIYLTPEERTLLIVSSKKDPIVVCVPLNSKVKKYKGMHCTLIDRRKKVYA